MELKEFIKQTLSQLAEGIREGHQAITQNGGGVGDEQYTKVDFDIAVYSDEHSKTEAGGKITVASVLSGGANSEKLLKSSNHSRIQFSLLVSVKTFNRKSAGIAIR